MILDQLLGDIPRTVFMEQHYLKQPFALPGGCRHLLDSAGWPMVEAILHKEGVDFLAARPEKVWQGTPTPERARQLLDDGYTLRIRKAEQHDPVLTELMTGFREAFCGAVDIHIYCTPADHMGLNWHYDAEDVFILQTQGSKTWWLRKNTVNPWPLAETIPENMRYERELTPMMKCDLQAGDWLYLPAGYWHRTQAREQSISLSVGIFSLTALDVYDFLRSRLTDSLRWRQRLPTPGSAGTLTEEELTRQYKELFADLACDVARMLQQEETVRDFLKQKRQTTC